jgi:hypothetical protein
MNTQEPEPRTEAPWVAKQSATKLQFLLQTETIQELNSYCIRSLICFVKLPIGLRSISSDFSAEARTAALTGARDAHEAVDERTEYSYPAQ